MKTFTTYAEKKAKQFFNLLQGYTKGIRMTAILILLLMGVSNAWANGGIGYKGVKFTNNNTTTGWYNIHDVSWGYAHTDYDCRASTNGVTAFNNADLGVVTSLKLHSFVVIGWTDNSDWVSGQLKYRTYLQSASAGNYNVYNVGNYETYCNATDVLATSGNDRVVGKNGNMNITLVDNNTAPGKYYLQLQGMGRMRYCNGNFNTNDGSAVKASYTVPGFDKTTAIQDFGSVGVGSNISKTISFTNHYGTKLTTSNCVLSGTNKSEFSVTSISETGVTVKFTPSSSGSKSATLTITDAHSKKCTITLSGTATLPTYTVTFNANGHGTAPAAQTVSQGSKATQPTAPTATGYTFGGWYKEAGCTNAFDFNTAINADITLYAKWTANQYTITYKDQGNVAFSGTHASGYPTTHTYGTATTLKTASKTGYTFEGWHTDAACTKKVTSLGATAYTADITLYAKWTAQAQPDPTHEIYLVGLFNHWTNDDANYKFEKTSPGIYTLTKDFTKRERYHATDASQAEWEFKLRVDGTNYTVGDDGNGRILQYTRQNTTKIVDDGSDNSYNLLLQADQDGDYIFTYEVATKRLTVTHPKYYPEASYIVGDFSDEKQGTDATPKDGEGGKDWTEKYGKKFEDGVYCIELGKNSTWNFKIKINGIWYGASDVHITGSGTYTLNNQYADTGTDNCTIETNGSDECYRFSYVDNGAGTITLTVAYPEEDEVEEANTVYLKLNNDWKKDDARFAVYYWNDGGNTWKDLEAVDCNGDYYKAEVPEGYSKLIFARMKPNTKNDWNNKDGIQSPDLTLPTDGKNLYDVELAKYLYLTPNSKWKEADARFAAYFFGNGENWVNMTDDDGDGIYTCEKQSGFPQVIFCRMNPQTTANNWDNKWNQTGDQWIQGDGKDHFILTADSWDQGTWAHYSWSTYTAPTYDVKINITGKGSIVIDGQTYTSNSTGTITQTRKNIDVNTNINVTAITPADRWANKTATIKIGNNTQETLTAPTSHSICGSTTINVTFEQTQFVVGFDLNLPQEVTYPAIAPQIVNKHGKATEPNVNDAGGYLFCGWYKEKTCTNKYNFSETVNKDMTLYAKWVGYDHCIFFKNNLSWKDVYVYTFSNNAWYENEDPNTKYGPGVCTKVNVLEFAQMTRIDKTDIYYYVLKETQGFNHIAFSDANMNDWNEFFGSNAIYRADRNDQLQLFVPEKGQTPSTTNSTQYHSRGIWMKYNSTYSGYDWSGKTANADWDDTALNAKEAGGYTFTATIDLNADTNYDFKISNVSKNAGNESLKATAWFGKNIKISASNCTNLNFKNEDSNNAIICPTIAGKYVFTIYLGDGKVMLSVEYPLSVGDYRLAYKDKTTNSHHPGHYLKKHSETQTDTVSFFIHHNQQPEIIVEECTKIQNGIPTWEKVEDITNNPAASITESGVYNFFLQQVEGNTLPTLVNRAMPYIGSFYIRTDAASGGWESFRQEGNKMTYSSFAETNTNPNFNHYFCKWITANRNVKFTIANDYSYCISDTLDDDDDIIKKDGVSPGCLPADANVRFGWDSRDNSLSRAYIAGSGHKKDRFLVIEGNSYLTDKEGHTYTGNTAEGQERFNLKDHEVVLDDMGNWIYQMDVTANAKTEYKLTALYNDIVQYFKGTSTTTERMLATDSQDDDTSFKIRLIYDFKSNHIVAAWLADDTQGAELGADMMVIRKNQGDATQIDFNGAKLTNVQKAYAVMTFTKDFVNDSQPIHTRKHYWISFPFDVKISEVFGFSEYMDHWILQLYDGQKRADEGWWYESGTFWKYITNKNYTLQKGVGYVLTLDLSKMGTNSSVFENTDEVSLYFPSTGLINTIGEETTSTTVDPHECTIERENRKIYDSHWNIIGVPGFADISEYSTEKPIINDDKTHGGGPSFYYEYLPTTNSYQATTTENTFKTMYGYMVQYTGTLSWTTTIAVPNNIAARRNSDNTEPEKVSLRLEIAQDEEMADQTFVQLQQEGATAEFDMNLDLTKIINSGANIYTLAGEQRIQSAGNALPMGEAVVPVGVKIDAEGEYTFRMPDGTEGMVVELIDYELETTTNLLLFDYTVTLPKGTNEGRFALHIQPSKSGVTTGIEGAYPQPLPEGKGTKFLINGKLIIRTAEGVVYDAQGHRL